MDPQPPILDYASKVDPPDTIERSRRNARMISGAILVAAGCIIAGMRSDGGCLIPIIIGAILFLLNF